ncbi:uncharacterized protein PADG_11655 [Paracoccidioides brasiliensis Pb18]|uniref:Uncharacterized protein n=1 Tax=Paracoccidioides brasiliensis (strain Pb18) TaxID=502780 RepID=A0A0A0HXJ3_PARBD|nr:uncharacterized protein PADG_11655 [Paracoccidioides brasiliensis Pb18]KGM92120.1 hypothetical protein PADG_11655 [Paracoccidioides brasiliensis Pb18]
MAAITCCVTDPSGTASHFITTMGDMKGCVERLERIKKVLDEFPDAIKYQKRSMDKTEVTLNELCNASDVDATVKARIFEYIQRHQANRCEMEHQHVESHRTYRSESEKECHGSCSEEENERL